MLVALRSRRQIAPFTMHRPTSVADALALCAEPGPSAYLAGGIDLIDWLKYGNPVNRVIRLDGIPGLADITGDTHALRIGAMATHAAIAASKPIRDVLPDLGALWPTVANPRVRFTGTVGGNVMAGKAEYDALPALMALGATAELDAGAAAALDAIDPLALVTAFTVPEPATQRLFTDRSLRPALTVWLGLTMANSHAQSLRVAVGMAHPKPVCVTLKLDLPFTSLGHASAAIAADVTAMLPEPASDGKASAAYRRRMVEVLTRRILQRAGDSA
jgi:aerobic carbon-monoxide dehydrogenase medium subunit